MGVEYRRLLIPKPSTLRPSAELVVSLVEELRRNRWLVAFADGHLSNLTSSAGRFYDLAMSSGYYIRTFGKKTVAGPESPEELRNFLDVAIDQDLMLTWPVESLGTSGLNYPLIPLPFDSPQDAADCYYELQIHLGRDFIYHVSEDIDPFDDPLVCVCGESLEYDPPSGSDPFFASRIARSCPRCGRAFDPSDLPCSGKDGWTGEALQIPGGATYRFALAVDCGKFFGRRPLTFNPALKRLVETTIASPTYEVGDFY